LDKKLRHPYGCSFTAFSINQGQQIPCFDQTSIKADKFEANIIEWISKYLWPVFNPLPSVACASGSKIEQLTLADLDILKRLNWMTQINPANVKHSNQLLFRAEDLSATGMANSFSHYLFGSDSEDVLHNNPMQSATCTEVQSIVLRTTPLSLGMLYRLKEKFQRMRPYQAAYLLGKRHEFDYYGAATAFSPSVPSGHCLQGMLAACNILSSHLSGKIKLDNPQLQSLKQIAVDIGDRRVFAGVHYPSDNIASWYCMFQLIPVCFSKQQKPIRAFVQQSLLKSAVMTAIGNAQGGVYQEAIKALNIKWP
jgi:hypothetical protein